MSTQSVIRHHVQALAEGDLEATMIDYADDCVFIGSSGVTQDKSGVEQIFAGALANGPFAVTLKTEHYHGDTAFITWEVPGMITLGTDTFVVRDGLIVLQTNAVAFAG